MDTVFEPDELLREHLDSPWGELGRSATLAVISLVGKFVINVMNTSVFENKDRLLDAVMARQSGIGLITVANHSSTLDDPMLFSAMLPLTFFLTEHNHHKTRWSLCAREMCYRNSFLSQFFQSGKTLPVERGAGISQPIMKVVSKAVARGDWVHVFPEGKIHYSGTLGPLRWGVGKLFCDSYLESGVPPIVIPFYHRGMNRVLPKHGRIPRPGHKIHLKVGESIDLSHVCRKCASVTQEGKEAAWKEITEEIRIALQSLEKDV